LKTTNYQGITFPLNATYYAYTPLPKGKTRDDLYLSSAVTLNIQEINIGGKHLEMEAAPKSLVALDMRFGLPNNRSVNYEVLDDQWESITNKRLQQLYRVFSQTRQLKPSNNQ
jgi:hypothetical protein